MFRKFLVLFVSLTICLGTLSSAKAQQSEITNAVVALSKDPVFQESIVRFFRAIKAIDTGLRKMPEEDRNRLFAELREFHERQQSSTSKSHLKVRQRVEAISGVTADDFEKIGQISKGLIKRHPILLKGPAAVGEATQFLLMEYSFSTIDPDYQCDTACQCLRACKEARRQALNDAGLSSFWNLISEPSPFGWGLTIITFPAEAEEIYQAELECKEECFDFGPGFNCQSDGDCNANEFCQNVFGNPVNSCQQKRSLGQACSADRKCESGCCKYHLWTNPVQMVCRPVDKCN